jgi:hypothetical protein
MKRLFALVVALSLGVCLGCGKSKAKVDDEAANSDKSSKPVGADGLPKPPAFPTTAPPDWRKGQ